MQKFYKEKKEKLDWPQAFTFMALNITIIAFAPAAYLFTVDKPVSPEDLRIAGYILLGAVAFVVLAPILVLMFEKKYEFHDLTSQKFFLYVSRRRIFLVSIGLAFTFLFTLFFLFMGITLPLVILDDSLSLLHKIFVASFCVLGGFLGGMSLFVIVYTAQMLMTFARAPFYAALTKEGIYLPALSTSFVPWSAVLAVSEQDLDVVDRLSYLPGSLQLKISQPHVHLRPKSSVQKWLLERQVRFNKVDYAWVGLIDISQDGIKPLFKGILHYAPHVKCEKRGDFLGRILGNYYVQHEDS